MNRIKRLIKKHVLQLQKDQAVIEIERDGIFPVGSFGYKRLTLGIAVIGLKIAIWEAII